MASSFSEVAQFADSPKGNAGHRAGTDTAQQPATDPKSRAKIEDVRRRLQGGRSGATGAGPTA